MCGQHRVLSGAGTLDAVLLRVLPAVLFAVTFYPMCGFHGGASHVALFFLILAVFSATVGSLSMAISVGELVLAMPNPCICQWLAMRRLVLTCDLCR
jgi:hypothetical protein